ncbi:MAG: alpha/beta fold hydrolase [Janthinobacterium lividum]
MSIFSKRWVVAVIGFSISTSLPAIVSAQSGQAQVWPAIPAPDQPEEPGPGWPPRIVDHIRPLPGKVFKEGFVDLEGFHIRYIEAGKGPIVIVSFPGSGGLEMSTAKDILARDYRVIEINPPGWGPDPIVPGKRTQKDMATMFVHVLDKLGIDKFHLIGTSMGCIHAMYAAEAFPDRVLSLTFEGGECFTRPEDRRIQTPRAVAAQDTAAKGGTFDDDYSIWAGWPAYQWAPNKWWQTPSFQARLMRRRYVNNFPHLQFGPRDDMILGAKALRMPTLDMVGDRDEIMKMSVAQAWKQHMPQARVAVVAGATHDIQNSQPEQFVEIMKACSLDPSPSKLMCPGD